MLIVEAKIILKGFWMVILGFLFVKGHVFKYWEAMAVKGNRLRIPRILQIL